MTTDPHGWRPIETMLMNQHVLVSDGALVKPGTRVSADVIASSILMRIGMWTHWQPRPVPAMSEQSTESAQRSAHVSRGEARAEYTPACCVCGREWKVASYAAARGDGVPVIEVCSAECAERAGWRLTP